MNENGKQGGIADSIERHLIAYFNAHEETLPASGLYDRVLQEMEAPLLKITLDKCGGNQIKAAALLGLNRNTLRKKLRLLGLKALNDNKGRKRRT